MSSFSLLVAALGLDLACCIFMGNKKLTVLNNLACIWLVQVIPINIVFTSDKAWSLQQVNGHLAMK